ncbi:MAG: DegT/DnrJ/EryC1/StrS family aminotransferase [Treponema sp.]|jgi:dTDP-4-amino-4,6-dideoxygalactose transaminase|nr:DegT/DnrJ/EryC1/StrS family aminotransferase [Treponema sp.]
MVSVYAPTIRRREMDAVLTALVEDKVGPGERSEFLIQTAKECLGFDSCISLRSPVMALALALKLLNIEEGKGVLVSALSPLYYLQVIQDLRLTPVVCDVGEGQACISKETALSTLDGKDVRAIIVHHTLGFVPETAAIAEIGVPVIEDCSLSCGTFVDSVDATERGASRVAPFQGTFVILGLEERDMLTAGGGALLFALNRRNGIALKNAGRLLPEYGLPDMNAAMAVVQFRDLTKNLKKRKEIAHVYTQASLHTRHKRFIAREDLPYNNYAFPLILETGMKDVKAYARKKGIEVENAFSGTVISGNQDFVEQCPVSASLSRRAVLFPLYPRLTSADVEKTAKIIGTLP